MNLAHGINLAKRLSRGIATSSYVLFDDFLGTNNATLVGQSPTIKPNSNNWLVPLGSFVSNQGKAEARFPSLGNAILNFITEDEDADIYTTFSLPASGSPRSAGIIFRRTGNSDFFAAMINFDEQSFKLIDVTGGVTNTLDQRAFTVVAGVNYAMRVILNGNLFIATVDGVGSLTAESATRNTEKRHGLRAQNTAVTGPAIAFDYIAILPPPPPADVYVTIAGTPLLTSAIETAVIHNHNDEIWFGAGGATARDRAMQTLTGKIAIHDNYLISGGVPDVWPLTDPASWTPGDEPVPDEPTNWASLDLQMQRELTMGGQPSIRIHLFEWWMKGHLQENGTTIPAVYPDDRFTEDGRLMTQYLPHEKLRVRRMCERYMVSPYNIRQITLGIEYHGWQLGSTTGDDENLTYDHLAFHDYPGTAGLNANMGYAFYHNEIVDEILAVAAELEIAESELIIVNNYSRIFARTVPDGDSVDSLHPLYDTVWGTAEAKGLEALESGLPLLNRVDAVALDFGNRNEDHDTNGPATDDVTNMQRVYDIVVHLRDDILTPLALQTLPIIISERYFRPQEQGVELTNYQLRAMLEALGMYYATIAGVWQACLWGFRGRSTGNSGGGMTEGSALVTSISTVDGGEGLPVLDVVEMFNDHFSAGVDIYELTIVGTGIVGFASDENVLLINTTNDAKVVRIDADLYDVAGPGYRLIERL